jgi:hypothetical protein
MVMIGNLLRFTVSCLIERGEEHSFMVFISRMEQVCHRLDSFDYQVPKALMARS